MPPKKPAARKPSGTLRRRRGVKVRPTELGPGELLLAEGTQTAEVVQLTADVRADGGAVLAVYREPLGGHTLLLAALPIDKVVPTPFQRDISDAHVRRLTHAMDKTKRFLDPIVVVREVTEAGHYWTPNGYHRLTAMKELGAKTILALLVPERAVAFQILALNIEKAHNLREKAISVRRMYVDLAANTDSGEEDLALEFEEPALITLGFAYEQRGRLSGGVYHSVLRKVDSWIKGSASKALPRRQQRAALLLEFDEAVTAVVDALKKRGMQSPYLRNFVVARVNPLRFMKGEPPPLEELLPSMTKRARGMNVEKINPGDVARSGGAPEAGE
ncbi:MAG: ParB family transcriptional regulator, chromosome partitioning protein [Myxococcales bacterium]|jgi:ParB family chromosome partitioning protein|nr:ParB family transcriptional regulator, chromosome partitioning protein [Myxococcales bacterium]